MRILILCLLLAAGSCACAADQSLRLHGSNTVGENLAPALVRGWLERDGYEDIEVVQQAPLERVIIGRNERGQRRAVEIHAHGSSTSFRDLAAGTADIGMSSRRIRASECAELARFGRLDSPDNEFVIGIDGLAVIVHPDNPVTALPVDRIRDIFAGRIRNWRAVGGPDRRISLYARDDKSGTYDSFDSMVLQGATLAAAERFESSTALSDSVAADPGGIGFIGLPYVRDTRALVVSAGGRPVAPDIFTSATEDYPLSRRLYLYIPDNELQGLGGSLAEFAVSHAGQVIVDGIGFVGQAIELGDPSIPADAPADYRGFVAGARRISLNFRFERGKASLDTKAVRDLNRLAEFMKQPENDGLELMLMGFSDPSEIMGYLSLALSNDRVDYVAGLLANRDVRVHRTRGFGDAVLLAEGTGETSKAKNQRVEVWVRDPGLNLADASTSSNDGGGSGNWNH